MNMSGSQDWRILNLQFDAAVKNDVGFKIEVISLIIISIRELLKAAYQAYDTNDASLYHSLDHKSRSMVRILNDKEFEGCIKDLKKAFSLQQGADCLRGLEQLKVLADSIIKSLERMVEEMRGG
jgi:hypothetical protein